MDIARPRPSQGRRGRRAARPDQRARAWDSPGRIFGFARLALLPL